MRHLLRQIADLPRSDQLALANALRPDLPINWEGPWRGDSISDLPERHELGAIYCWVVERQGERLLIRIGATKTPRRRARKYAPAFELVDGLAVYYGFITDAHINAVRPLIEHLFPDRAEDLAWLEYRWETLLIDGYKSATGSWPPGNFDSGARRDYLSHVRAPQRPFSTEHLPPAELTDATRALFHQGKGTQNTQR